MPDWTRASGWCWGHRVNTHRRHQCSARQLTGDTVAGLEATTSCRTAAWQLSALCHPALCSSQLGASGQCGVTECSGHLLRPKAAALGNARGGSVLQGHSGTSPPPFYSLQSKQSNAPEARAATSPRVWVSKPRILTYSPVRIPGVEFR